MNEELLEEMRRAVYKPQNMSTAVRMIVPQVLFPEEHAELLHWATQVATNTPTSASEWWCVPISSIKGRPDVCRRVRRRIHDAIGVDSMQLSRGPLAWHLSIVPAGREIPPLVELPQEKMKWIRCILLLQQARSGGSVFLEDGIVPLNERDLLVFRGCRYAHACTPVRGTVDRIALSLGQELPVEWDIPGLPD